MAERTQWFGSWLIIRDHIVQSNLGLVYAMLRRSYVPDQDEDERLSEALCGLSRAVERFNPWRGCRFSTYACSAITRALLRHRDREARYRQRFPMRYSAAFECPGDKPDFTKPLCVERLARIMAGNHGVLTSIEARVIAERFPECSRRRMTFQEIGDAVSLSKERVRQIQNIALGKLREAMEADPLLGPEL
jgi:RNA polymerase primary sigma factor